jgi:hypothetical protein
MKEVFKPQRSLVITIVITSYALTLYMCGVLLYAGNSIKTLIPAFLTFLFLGSIFPLAAVCSKVVIREKKIFLTTFPFFTKEIAIADIHAINFLVNYVGMGRAIEIHAKMNSARISVGAYGDEQASEILKAIIEVNSHVELDERTRKHLM